MESIFVTPALPVPASATADEWNCVDTATGLPMRSLEWSRHDTAKVGVGVDGWQDAAGSVHRHISLYSADAKELTAADARALAAALFAAAAKLDEVLR